MSADADSQIGALGYDACVTSAPTDNNVNIGGFAFRSLQLQARYVVGTQTFDACANGEIDVFGTNLGARLAMGFNGGELQTIAGSIELGDGMVLGGSAILRGTLAADYTRSQSWSIGITDGELSACVNGVSEGSCTGGERFALTAVSATVGSWGGRMIGDFVVPEVSGWDRSRCRGSI